MHIGPRRIHADRYRFTLWAPLAKSPALELLQPDDTQNGFQVRQSLPMSTVGRGYFSVEADALQEGQLYRFNLDNKCTRPDPASHHQPFDVHGPSALVDHQAFAWKDGGFRPPALEDMVIYELHIGTFSPQGDFHGAVAKLDHLADLGVNAVEVMPLAQFPGGRNWGYDGVHPFAVQHSYGGPAGFKRFVDACHGLGLAVILDVVYNHLGPEGNYLRDFAPYFTNAYKTPWGEALNFDGPLSDGARNHFIQNALHWYEHYRVDGLRLDATHAIYDERPVHVLAELAAATRDFEREHGRKLVLIAESDRNDPRLALPPCLGGHGLDAIWSDDFHHAMHVLLTGEDKGYYQDYTGLEHVARALRHGFAYQGEYSPFRQRGHGADATLLPRQAHVFCIQNHDQVGNRMLGERLTTLAPFEALKLAAGLLLFAPATPMLFMGEEYGETNPFLYFISHLDENLVQAVRKGRKREFKSFKWRGEPPDPQAEETFARSRLDWDKLEQSGHKQLLAFYKECLRLRRELGPLARAGKAQTLVWANADAGTLVLQRSHGEEQILCLCNLHPEEERHVDMDLFGGVQAPWEKMLESSDTLWNGPGPSLPARADGGVVTLHPHSLGLYHASSSQRIES